MFDSTLGIVIPFKNPRQYLLESVPSLIRVKEQVLFLRTVEQLQVEEELQDFCQIMVGAEINIQRWWNLGINFFISRGGYEFVLIANDDISFDLDVIYQCVEKLRNSGGTLGKVSSSNGGQWGHAIFLRLLPNPGKVALTPHLHGSYPEMKFADQTFRWFFGDGDLELQHRRSSRHMVTELGMEIFHFSPNQNTLSSNYLQLLTEADEASYVAKWKKEKFRRSRAFLVIYRIRLSTHNFIHKMRS
jgi:hypothetical protein